MTKNEKQELAYRLNAMRETLIEAKRALDNNNLSDLDYQLGMLCDISDIVWLININANEKHKD